MYGHMHIHQSDVVTTKSCSLQASATKIVRNIDIFADDKKNCL